MFKKKQKPAPGRQRADRSNNVAAFSYYARRSDRVDPALERQSVKAASGSRHGPRFTRRKSLIASGLIILTLLALINVSLAKTPSVVIEPAAHSQAVLRSSSLYEDAVAEYMDDSLLNQNKLTITTDEVSRRLLARFPELSQAQLVLPLFGRTPVLHLRATEPVVLLATSSGTYALDASGIALVTDAQLGALGDLQLPLITDETGLPGKLYGQSLTTQNVRFVRNIVTQLTARDMVPTVLTLPAGGNQLNVRLEGQPYYLKFNLASDTPAEQAGTAIALIERLREQGATPAEYIDVRVDGRAYYK